MRRIGWDLWKMWRMEVLMEGMMIFIEWEEVEIRDFKEGEWLRMGGLGRGRIWDWRIC